MGFLGCYSSYLSSKLMPECTEKTAPWTPADWKLSTKLLLHQGLILQPLASLLRYVENATFFLSTSSSCDTLEDFTLMSILLNVDETG